MASDDEPQQRPRITLEMLDAATRRRSGPMKSFVLLISGVNRKLLRFVPTEEAWFSVIGTLVMVSTLTAGVGAFTTAGYYFEGRVTATTATVAVAVGWAALIFLVERCIIKTPLNQIRFSHDVMEMMSGAESDAVFQEIEGGQRVYAVKRTPAAMPGIFVAISFRLAIAFLASFLVAEAVLMAIYAVDIEPMVKVKQNAIATEVLASDTIKRTAEIKDTEAKIATAIQGLAPGLAKAQESLPVQEQEVADLQNDVALIRQAYAAECNGRKVDLELSTGYHVQTTGKPGCGPIAPGALLALKDEYQDKVEDAQDVVDKTDSDIDGWERDMATDPVLVGLRAHLQELSCEPGSTPGVTEVVDNVSAGIPAPGATKKPRRRDSEPAAVDCPSTDASPSNPLGEVVRGIGIRESVLRDLEQDTEPATVAIERAAPCASAWCSVERFFVYPSPAGRKVAAIRWILFLIECSAILTKLAFVLRRRRPYDTLVAALEVVYEGNSVAMAGDAMADVGLDLERKSARRRGLRVGALADLLLQRDARRTAKPGRIRKPQGGTWFGRLLGRTDEITEEEEFPEPPKQSD